MDDVAGVMDLGTDVQTDVDVSEPQEPQQETQEPKEEDGSKFSKEYRAEIKKWRDEQGKLNPNVLKYSKQAIDDHGRMLELARLDPKGINGVRETYAMIQAAGGPQAITELQQRVADYDQTDALLAAGDPKVLDTLGENFNEGLAKLTPALIDRLAQSNPQAYASALLPHLVNSLMQSDLVKHLDAAIGDLENSGYDEQTKLNRTKQALAAVSKWFQDIQGKAGEMKKAPAANPEMEKFQQEKTAFEQQRQKAFWDNEVTPDIVKYENTEIEKYLAPYQNRLKLDPASKAKLVSDIKQALSAAAKKDTNYTKQMQLYQSSKKPDAAAIKNFVQNGINRYVKGAVDTEVNARYGMFLKGRAATPQQNGAKPPASGNGRTVPIVVSAKPNHGSSPEDINMAATKRDGDMYKFHYVLNNGKHVVWKRQ